MTMTLTQVTTGGVDENINIDSNTLKVDGTNNRVGIGTASPASKFTVADNGYTPIEIQSDRTTATDNIGGVHFKSATTNVAYIQSLVNGTIKFRNTSSLTERMRIDSSGNVGIGTASPSSLLHLESASSPKLLLVDTTNSCTLKAYAQNSNAHLGTESNHDFIFDTNNTERLRIDTGGRLLVGTSSNTAPGSFDAKLQIADTSYTGSISLRRDSNNAGSQSLVFGKSRGSLNGNTIVQDGDALGGIAFYGADGTDLNSDAASIYAYVDGTPGSNDMPGRIVFSTAANGASSATERFRIDSSGNIGMTTAGFFGFNGVGDESHSIQYDSGIDGVEIRGQNGIKFATGSGSGTERMRLTSAGHLGIGTTSPSRPLTNADDVTLTTGNAPQFRLNGTAADGDDADRAIFGLATASGHFFSGAVAGDAVLRTTDGGNLLFGEGQAERMRIDSSGNLLIGTTSVLQSGTISIEHNGQYRNGIVIKTTYTGTGSDYIRFLNSSGTKTGEIEQTGTTAVTYRTSSDYRLKENVVNLDDGIERLKRLNPYRFSWIADGLDAADQDGFFAHEVQEVVPLAVGSTPKDAVDSDGNPEYQGIDHSVLVPLLTAALQEAIAKIETLETKVAALEAAA